jgi:hypothetical protein
MPLSDLLAQRRRRLDHRRHQRDRHLCRRAGPPDGTVVPPTGKSFDPEFGQTSKWQGDQLIVISAFWDSGLRAYGRPERKS